MWARRIKRFEPKYLNNSDEVFNAILADDVETFSQYVSDENESSKNINFKQRVPDIIKNYPSIISLAAFFGATEIVDYLISIGADVKQADKNDSTSIFYAAAGGNITIFKKLYDLDNTEFNAHKATPCMFAAEMGKIDIVKYIWSRNKDLILFEDEFCSQPIHRAAAHGHIDVVDFLLSQGAKVNARDKEGNTPLILAALCGSVELVKYLIEKKANVSLKAYDGMSSLCVAARNGSLSVAKILVENGAAFINKNDALPLVEACGSGHLDLVKFFVDKGARINSAAKDGLFPLMAAAKRNRVNIFDYLISKGAEIMNVNRESNLLEYACMCNSNDIVNYLLDKNIFTLKDIKNNFITICFHDLNDSVLNNLVRRGVDVLASVDYCDQKDVFGHESFVENKLLLDLLEEYEKLGLSKLGDMLKIARARKGFSLAKFLFKNRLFDFSLFKAKDKNDFIKLASCPSLLFLFRNEELMKDQKYREIIAEEIVNQRDIASIKEAVNRGIPIPVNGLQASGVLSNVFQLGDEVLFNALIDMGVDPMQVYDEGKYFYMGGSETEFSRMLEFMMGHEITDFHLRALKKILNTSFDVENDQFCHVALLFKARNPRIVAVVKESLKLTKEIIEKCGLLQICINEANYECFKWLISFKPNVFLRAKRRNSDHVGPFFCNGFKERVFGAILLTIDKITMPMFLDLLINEYDFTGKESETDIYRCLFVADDIRLFKKIKEHGFRFDTKFAISHLCRNYATINKEIFKFCLDSGVSPNSLSKEEMLESYLTSRRKDVDIRRADIQGILNCNKGKMPNIASIVNNALGSGLYKFATLLVQCGVKVKLDQKYLTFAEKLYWFYKSKINTNFSLYFTNVALENGCSFALTESTNLLMELLEKGKVNLFYILTKHGYRIMRSKARTEFSIELAKNNGIPECYIKSVISDKRFEK